MEPKAEKDLVYESLLDLTKKAEEQNRYFSVPRIFKYFNEKAQERRAIGKEFVNFSITGLKSKVFHAVLEELVDEGKVHFVIGDMGTNKVKYRLYRAIVPS